VRFVVVTGLSGSGKSAAVKVFEDLGAYCVDNLPVALLPRMVDLTRRSPLATGLVVLGMDIREPGFLREFPAAYRLIRARGLPIRLIFLEAEERVLVRRYSESRRLHPLGAGRSLVEAIRAERRRLGRVRTLADEVIDTGAMRVRDLRERLLAVAESQDAAAGLRVTVLSFGFKHGVPAEADLVFDVRFLANPYFVKRLRPLSGLDEPVRAHVAGQPETAAFLERLLPLLAYCVPLYGADGRAYLTIAIGCTGGRHRSPVVARAVAEGLRGRGHRVAVRDRDLHRTEGGTAP
jgi:UPF0042 nucleotide-binding protein